MNRRHSRAGMLAAAGLAAGLLASLPGCILWDDDDAAGPQVKVEGLAQKGPLEAGSVVVLLALDDRLRDRGELARTRLVDGGGYALQARTLSAHVEVRATGRYFDEIGGGRSAEAVELRAIAPVAGEDMATQANLNLLTTLVVPRVRELAAAGMAPAEALRAAEIELGRALAQSAGMGEVTALAQRDLVADTEQDAQALVASLVVLQASRDLATPLGDLVGRLAADLADNGVFDDLALSQALADARQRMQAMPALARLQQWYQDRGHALSLATAMRLVNQAPLAGAQVDALVLVGQPIHLDAGGSTDPEGGALSMRWWVQRQQNDGPWANTPLETFELEGPTARFTPAKTASYRIVLTVTDEFGASAQAESRAVARQEFRANGDGTVTNLQTGLMWQQFDDGNLYRMAEATGRSYLGIPNENGGLSVCASLSLAGHDDWRTPRLHEVESLRDFTFDSPRIDHVAFPGVGRTGLISDSWSPNSQGVFVEFNQGMVLRQSLGTRYPLHCVRP